MQAAPVGNNSYFPYWIVWSRLMIVPVYPQTSRQTEPAQSAATL